MTQRVFAFDCTVPPGTAIAAPFTQALAVPPGPVSALEIRVPPGPRGNVGFAIGSSGVPIFPEQKGAWIVADDERIDWALEEQITSGAWEFFGYNLGRFAHTIRVRLLMPPAAPAPAPAVIPSEQLNPTPPADGGTVDTVPVDLTGTLPDLPALPALPELPLPPALDGFPPDVTLGQIGSAPVPTVPAMLFPERRAWTFDGFIRLFGRNPNSEDELNAIAFVVAEDRSNLYDVRVSMWNDPRARTYRSTGSPA